MRVLIMDTSRGTSRGTVDLWRERLSLEPEDTLSLLTWYPPGEPLPVAEHLVCGPRLVPTQREPRRAQTLFDVFHDADISGADMPKLAVEPSQQAQQADASLGDHDLAGQLPEQSTAEQVGGLSPNTPDQPTHAAPHTPAAPAAQGRFDRARRSARDQQRRGGALLRSGDSPAARTFTRRAVRLHGEGIATLFALATMRSRDAAELFHAADVVVPVEMRSQRAAWALAQRVAGPDVVVTYPAAVRAITARR